METRVPKSIVFGYGNDGRGKTVTYITELKPSKRAKNGLFTIPNEKSFKKKINNSDMQRAKNELKSGYSLDFGSRHRSRGGIERYFYLQHKDFTNIIPISYESFLEIMFQNTIENGVIKEKLIWTSTGFHTEKQLDEILKSEASEAEAVQNQLQNISEPRAFKKDLVPGKLYAEHRANQQPTQHIFFGTLSTKKGEFNMLATTPSYMIRNLDSALARQNTWPYFESTFVTNYNPFRQNDPAIAFGYQLHGKYAFLQNYRFTPRKGLPKLWQNPGNSPYRKNLFDGMTLTEVGHVQKIMQACPVFAKKQDLKPEDIYGMPDLAKYIQTRVVEEKEELTHDM